MAPGVHMRPSVPTVPLLIAVLLMGCNYSTHSALDGSCVFGIRGRMWRACDALVCHPIIAP